jgi:hypothetical protein
MKISKAILVTVGLILVGSFVHRACRHRPPESGEATAFMIAVEVDKKRQEPITAERMTKQAPDRRYDGWKLWRLGALLGGGLAEGSYVELERADGTRAGFRTPPESSGVEVVLAADENGKAALFVARLTEAGARSALAAARTVAPTVKVVRVTTASPAAPRAAEGGRGRSVAGRRSGGAPAVAAAEAVTMGDAALPAAPLSVSRSNDRSSTWSFEDLGRVRVRGGISTERGAAAAWSLREVAATLLDKGERIGSLGNAQGQILIITPAEWADEARLPLLRVNHRGLWKFDWVDASTGARLAGGMRDVSALAVAP